MSEPKKYTIEFEIDPATAQGCLDTAMDSRMCIAYWDESAKGMRFSNVKTEPDTKHQDTNWVKEVTIEFEDPSTGKRRKEVLTYETIAQGVVNLSKKRICNESLTNQILELAREGRLGEMDIEQVDVCIQAALFNELVYG